jgi:hypothetical protein
MDQPTNEEDRMSVRDGINPRRGLPEEEAPLTEQDRARARELAGKGSRMAPLEAYEYGALEGRSRHHHGDRQFMAEQENLRQVRAEQATTRKPAKPKDENYLGEYGR